MLSERLGVIKRYLNSEEKANSVIEVLSRLRKSDVITTTLLSRKAKITTDEAGKILAALVDQKILEFFIIVECINPNTRQEGEIHHYKYFSSIREFNDFSIKEECLLCECGAKYDLKNAKIGFRLARG